MIERPLIGPLKNNLEDEVQAVRDQAIINGDLVEPNEQEKRNGWTAETLTKYLSERLAAQTLAVDVNSLSRRVASRPNEQNHRYRPHRWRD